MGSFTPPPQVQVTAQTLGDDRNSYLAQNAAVQNTMQNGSPLAAAQLQSATNQNIANSTGVIASAKGLNPAMAARQAGYNAANSGQVAANQSAQTQAQIQLAAQSQMSNNVGNLYNEDLSSANQNNALAQQNLQFNSAESLANAKMGMGMLSSAVGMAAGGARGGMVPQKLAGGGMLGGLLGGGGGGGGSGGDSSMMGGNIPDPIQTIDSLTKEGTAHASDDVLSQNTAPDPVEQTQNPYQAISGFFNSLDQAVNPGPVSKAGVAMAAPQPVAQPFDGGKPVSANWGGGNGKGLFNAVRNDIMDQASYSDAPRQSIDSGDQPEMARGGKVNKKVPALLSPGETYLRPNQAKAVAQGKADALKIGERIPGVPKVRGNSYANDIVPKTLESGGVVIPNSVMQSNDKSKNAYKFVQAVMGLKAKGKK